MQNKSVNEIIAADRAMSELAGKAGFFKALSTYADADFVKLNEGYFPIIGKQQFDEEMNTPGPTTISWEPVKVEASQSGDLGYSWGNWKFIQNDTTTTYGNYFTVWKKQPDGTWKVVLDGGNTTPSPK